MAITSPLVRRDSASEAFLSSTTLKVLDILESFGRHEDSPKGTSWLGRTSFGPIIEDHVRKGKMIPMLLPAFPWKSVNRVDKVLGSLPDLGEELALARLNDLCRTIEAVYEPGAMVLIATDGLCYNAAVGISDEDVWNYGSAMRAMAAERGYSCIQFVRMMNLLGIHTDSTITKERYLDLCAPSRHLLREKYGNPDFDANEFLKHDADYLRTYLGYIKFLEKDLAHSPVTAKATSGRKYRVIVKSVAKDMIAAGVAFAKLVREVYSHYVRLSIHPSSGATKLSVPLIPRPNCFSMSPWHSAVAVSAQGDFITKHVSELRETHDLFTKNGRAFGFRERSALFTWDTEVEFQHYYDRCLVIRNLSAGKGVDQGALGQQDYVKLGALVLLHNRVHLSGF